MALDAHCSRQKRWSTGLPSQVQNPLKPAHCGSDRSFRAVCVCVCVCACAIAQSCMTLHHPIDCSPPVSPIHGTSQARILQWFAISSSRGSSRPRDQNRICCLAGRFFTMGRNFKAHRGFLTSLTKWTSAKLDYCLRIWTCLCSSKSNANCLVPVALCPTLPSISASLRHRA